VKPRAGSAAELARRDAQIAALGRVAHLLATFDDAERTMAAVADEGMRLFGAERAGVFLFEDREGPVRCMVARGLSPGYVEAVRRRFRELPAVGAVLRTEAYFVADVREDPDSPIRAEARREGVAAIAALPLAFGGSVFGALAFYHDRPRRYAPHEQTLARAFADQAALAIGKSRLFETVVKVKQEWQSAFDGVGSGLALVDARGRIERANRFVAELARVPVTELPGIDIRGLFAGWPTDGSDPLSEARRRGGRWSGFFDTRDGRPVVVLTTPRPDGGFVVAVDDVTAYVRLEARYSRVVETARDTIILGDAEGRVTFANPAAETLFGVPPAALVGSDLGSLIPEEDAQRRRPSGARARRFETIVRRPDGFRIAEVSHAMLEEGGSAIGTVTVARDVTAERLATEALRRSERRYRALVLRAPLGIVTLDRRGTFLTTNRAALRLAGLDAPARPIRVDELVVPAEREAVRSELDRSFRGETREFVFRFRQADGAVRQCFAVTVPVEEQGGRAVLAIARDVTDEIALRERLGQAEKMAALGTLISGVAHELNNPLAGIGALAQAATMDLAPEHPVAETLRSIQREVMRAARIVTDLLAFARARPLEIRATDLNQLVRDIFAASPSLRHGGVDWTLDLGEAVPAIPGDPEQLRQVLLNLLVNASQAMRDTPRREGRVRTWLEGDWVGFEVEDSGPGIAEDALPRIFEPFFTTKPTGAGTGLGLSISHGIVRAHGGEVVGANRPEGGARFSFRLPRDLTSLARTGDG
jgi:PAS domain S-box-containing protein